MKGQIVAGTPIRSRSSKLFLVPLLVGLIIAIVGIFLLFDSPCKAQNGFYCSYLSSGLYANVNGTLNFDLGQKIAPYIYNLQVACTYGNFSPMQSEYRYIGTLQQISGGGVSAGGNPIAPKTGVGSVLNGDMQIDSLQCFDSNGTNVSNLTSGGNFHAYVWATYTENQGSSGLNNQAFSVIAETISTKVG